MKNLNSKKARQEISLLFAGIQVLGWRMDDYIAKAHSNVDSPDKYYEGFNRAKAEQNKLIIELVEVYGIPNTRYEDAKRAEKRAA